MSFILPLSADPEVTTLELAGGKGRNLAILKRRGFRVPPGAIVTTEAYNKFVSECSITEFISTALEEHESTDEASAAIRAKFDECASSLSDDIKDSIRDGYATIGKEMGGDGDVAVAVRSSATAEDLPDMSFAGQQDTVLNVVAVASGVMTTANPVTGLRDETLIDITLGLGEALVSGQVDPDHYELRNPSLHTRKGSGDTPATAKEEAWRDWDIIKADIGKKETQMQCKPASEGGGIATVSVGDGDGAAAEAKQAVSDTQVKRLAAIGARIVAEIPEFEGLPQDIEFATGVPASLAGAGSASGEGDAAGAGSGSTDDDIWILQARPLTNLYPIPQHILAIDPPQLMFYSVGTKAAVFDPMYQFNELVYHQLIRAGLSYKKDATEETFRFLVDNFICLIGGRMYTNFGYFMNNSAYRKKIGAHSELLDPALSIAYEAIKDDPVICNPATRTSAWTLIKAFRPLFMPLFRAYRRCYSRAAEMRPVIQAEQAALVKKWQRLATEAKEAGGGGMSVWPHRLVAACDLVPQVINQECVEMEFLQVMLLSGGLLPLTKLAKIASKLPGLPLPKSAAHYAAVEGV